MGLHHLFAPAHSFLLVHDTDVSLTLAVASVAGVWLLIWQRLTSHGFVPSLVTRKVIHISCGPMFLAAWPFFSDAPSARLLACVIPITAMTLLGVSGSASEGQTVRAALGRAISREGKAAEALQGPFYYSVVLFLSSVFFFKSPIAIILVMQLCFGDGAAEVAGRQFGKKSKWGFQWTGDKSMAGTLGFFLSAFVGSCGGLTWWKCWGLTDLQLSSSTTLSIAIISAVCAAFELAPKDIAGDDNLTIPVVAIMATLLTIGWGAF